MAKVSRIIGDQLFPERQLLLQSVGGVRHLSLPGWLQAMVLAACLVSIGGIAYLAVGFARLHDALDTRIVDTLVPQAVAPAAVPAVDQAGADPVQGDLAQLRQELAAVKQNYADINARYLEAHDKLAALSSDNDQMRADLNASAAQVKNLQNARDEADRRAKAAEQALNARSGSVSQILKNLDDNKSILQDSETQRTALQNRVQQLQMDVQSANSRAAQLATQLDARDRAASPPIPALAAQAAPGQSSDAPVMVPPMALPQDAAAPPVPPKKPDAVPHAQAASSDLEKLLASTGVDVERLLGKLETTPTAQGGPFIALGDARLAEFGKQRLEDLKKLAKMLPLAPPLASYQIESGFGPRIDPINHRPSFHPGLDLSAPYMSTVYSTAPGTVIFTGTKEGYGRTVDIDHGHGIVTRYAHLHRILVARGQKVGVHVEIGELGSTGRATGPHVHYEVQVDGAPVDPAKFMEAGRNVVQISGN